MSRLPDFGLLAILFYAFCFLITPQHQASASASQNSKVNTFFKIKQKGLARNQPFKYAKM
jgi:hypothetical protein